MWVAVQNLCILFIYRIYVANVQQPISFVLDLEDTFCGVALQSVTNKGTTRFTVRIFFVNSSFIVLLYQPRPVFQAFKTSSSLVGPKSWLL